MQLFIAMLPFMVVKMYMNKLIQDCEQELAAQFEVVNDISLFNQEKVLNAFKENRIALRHFSGTTGYGYDDIGRDALSALFATVFSAEKAIVSPLIASGTHAISLALFGILRPGDVLLSVCGMPYDTLEEVIFGKNNGSLSDFGISFEKVDFINGQFDYENIDKKLRIKPKVVFIQRSRGYSWRDALSMEEISKVIKFVKQKHRNAIILIDNCYGEFTEKIEPTEVGADIVVGSLIKNPGGGIAPTGGYIVGKSELIQLIGYRLTAPGVGFEIGSYVSGYRDFYQGFFIAPHVTAQAIKGSMLFGAVFEKLGYITLPKSSSPCFDIIRSIKFNTKDELIAFCQAIQAVSPVDSFATPYPWDMPGYNHQVIMAAGTFVQGASIELSADSPIKEPYIAYLQGGLTYEHIKIAVKNCVHRLNLLKV